MVEYHHIDISVDKAIRYLEEHDEELFCCVPAIFLLNCRGFALNISIIISHNFKDEEGMNIVSARN